MAERLTGKEFSCAVFGYLTAVLVAILVVCAAWVLFASCAGARGCTCWRSGAARTGAT